MIDHDFVTFDVIFPVMFPVMFFITLMDHDLVTFDVIVLSRKFNWLHNSEESTYTEIKADKYIDRVRLKTPIKNFKQETLLATLLENARAAFPLAKK